MQGLGSDGQRFNGALGHINQSSSTETLAQVNVDKACPPKVSGIHFWHYLFNVGSMFDAVSPSTVFLQKTNTSKSRENTGLFYRVPFNELRLLTSKK